ncbi:MAG TPA: hypothetical protein VFJ97_03450 [Dermatophilaceae bacterium]|nr:hypothetical protein [Dermatophilaceae bacterium]
MPLTPAGTRPLGRLADQVCPWCGDRPGYRELGRSESHRLALTLLAQSAVWGMWTVARNPLGFALALQTLGRECACAGCGAPVRACPSCDRTHRYLHSGPLTCPCGTTFL